MSSFSCSILLISFFITISNSLNCYRCDMGYKYGPPNISSLGDMSVIVGYIDELLKTMEKNPDITDVKKRHLDQYFTSC